MKRVILVFLAALMVFGLVACSGEETTPTVVTTAPTTVPTTEPIPDITVHAMVPEEWSAPGCWAWLNGGDDAFEAWPGVSMNGNDGWYSVSVPGWVDHVIINGQDGALQTADLAVESGKDVWVHVVNADYAFVHYEEPAQETLNEEQNKPALDYHEAFYNVIYMGDYQITAAKAIAYNNSTEMYCSDYVPAELLAETPEEVYYVIRLINANKSVGYYFGVGGITSAIQQGLRIEIVELATDKVLAKSDPIMGGDPPESITTGQSGMGTPPSEAEINAWIDNAFTKILKSAPTELPAIPLNKTAAYEFEQKRQESMTGAEKALEKAKELVETRHLSYDYLIKWLTEYDTDNFSVEDATFAADNCGADWNENALLTAKEYLAEQPNEYIGYRSYAGLVNSLIASDYFTEAQAKYAADNCGADWNEQALLQAKFLTDDEDGFGYSAQQLTYWLSLELDQGGHGFTKQEAALAAKKCGANWAEEAVKWVKNTLEYSDTSYTKDQIVYDMVTYFGFTEADAIYGAEKNGLK